MIIDFISSFVDLATAEEQGEVSMISFFFNTVNQSHSSPSEGCLPTFFI